MIRNLKPYPAYKDSGVPWLGRVPEHWDVVPNRALLRPRKDVVGADAGDYTLLSLTKQGIIPRDLENAKGKFPTNFDSYQLVLPGDLVFCLFDIDETPRTVGLSTLGGMITGAYDRFECLNPSDGQFVYYYYLAMDNGKRLKPLYTGLRKVIQRSTFMSAKMPLPPVSEQAAIVRYLDHADRKVRHAIHARQQLIKLLTEQKQAIIQRAVTRGLDPSVPLKPSGVAWLGSIPKRWDVLPMKRCSSVISKGTTPSTEGREILGVGQIRFLKAENVSGGKIVNRPLAFIDEETHTMLRRSQLRQDDVLFVIAGATLGKTAIVRPEHLPANTNQAVAFVRPNRRVVPEFLALWLQSPRITEQVWLNAVQSAQPNLSMESLGMFSVPLPSREEQSAIVQYLDVATANLDNAIDAARREIDLLREYRTRLIADVVTGKLDVHDVPVPDDETDVLPEDMETIDDVDTVDQTDDVTEGNSESSAEETA